MYENERKVNGWMVVNYDKHVANEYVTEKGARKAYGQINHGELRQSSNIIFNGVQQWIMLEEK